MAESALHHAAREFLFHLGREPDLPQETEEARQELIAALDAPVSAPSERDVREPLARLRDDIEVALGEMRKPDASDSAVEKVYSPLRSMLTRWSAFATEALAAVPSRPGGDAERVLDAAIGELEREGADGRECDDPQRSFWTSCAARFLRDNRDRILHEAGPVDTAKEMHRENMAALRSASVAGPGKEGAR